MTIAIWTLMAILTGTVVYLNVNGVLPNDSIFEEVVEEGIEQVTGIDVDLSPPDE